MIEAQNLVKWYGPTRAVDGVSFSVPRGQIVGFLGPNGAGKSTTLRMLTGYLPPTSGAATIAGVDVLRRPRAARAQIGYLPESTPLYTEMRVSEYLDFRGRLLGMDRAARRRRAETVMDRCGLSAVRRRVIGHLSRGNRQRVGIAQALLHEPPVLILDEPTAGLDPNQVTAVRGLIAELRDRHTIMLSTHILPEVEKTADRVVIIAGGRVVAEGSPDELRRQVARDAAVVVEARATPEALSQTLGALPGVASVRAEAAGDGWARATLTPSPGAPDPRAEAGAALLASGVALRELSADRASLEAFFVQITAAQQRAAEPAPAA